MHWGKISSLLSRRNSEAITTGHDDRKTIKRLALFPENFVMEINYIKDFYLV